MSRYLGLFLEESREHIDASRQLLRELQHAPEDREALRSVFHHAHSLKGMAAIMGLEPITRIAHLLEDLLEVFSSQRSGSTVRGIGLISEGLDCLSRMRLRVERGDNPEDAVDEDFIARLRAAVAEQRRPGNARGAVPLPIPSEPEESPDETPAAGPAAPHRRRWRLDVRFAPAPSLPAKSVVDLLNRLVELGRVDRVAPPVFVPRGEEFETGLSLALETERSRRELEQALRDFEKAGTIVLTPESRPTLPKRSRPAAERWVRVSGDLLDSLLECTLEMILERASLERSLEPVPGLPPRVLDRFDLLLNKLYGQMTKIRLVPFEAIVSRLTQNVSRLAADLGKQVELEIEGRSLRLDRSILDALVEPLIHLLRNAIDHGIESPQERVERNKPPTGAILIRLERRGDRAQVTVEDDGRGLSADGIRNAAVRHGLLSDAEASRLSDREAYMLVTRAGFSTATAKTLVSGRGVGMDLVLQRVESMGGRLSIDSAPGGGACITLSLPLSLSLIQALMVRSAGELFALPISAIERTVDLAASSVERIGNRSFLIEKERRIELLGLAERLAVCSGSPHGSCAVLFPSGSQTWGLVVDEVLGRREIVVRPLTAPLERLREYTGAALLEEGNVALVLEPRQLTC